MNYDPMSGMVPEGQAVYKKKNAGRTPTPRDISGGTMWKQEYLKPFQFESDEPENDAVITESIKAESIEQITTASSQDFCQHIVRDQRYIS
jgi:hypothetical protein